MIFVRGAGKCLHQSRTGAVCWFTIGAPVVYTGDFAIFFRKKKIKYTRLPISHAACVAACLCVLNDFRRTPFRQSDFEILPRIIKVTFLRSHLRFLDFLEKYDRMMFVDRVGANVESFGFVPDWG